MSNSNDSGESSCTPQTPEVLHSTDPSTETTDPPPLRIKGDPTTSATPQPETTSSTTTEPEPDSTSATLAEPTTTQTTQTMSTEPSTTLPSSDDVAAFQRELVEELNVRRVRMGLPAVAFDEGLAKQATECSLASYDAGSLRHCDHEVLWRGGRDVSAASLIDSWFRSPLHKQALTYEGSTLAGGALVYRDDGGSTAVAALRINY